MELQNEEHFSGKVAQKALIVQAGKVLVMRDPREDEEIWELPGGRLNVDEEPKQGLAREIQEELGVEVHVGDVVNVMQFFQKSEGKNALMIAYYATIIDENKQMKLDDSEVLEVRFIAQSDMDSLKFFPEYEATLKKYFVNVS